MDFDDYLEYEVENDKCVESLSKAFISIHEAIDFLKDSCLGEHEDAVSFMYDTRKLLIDSLSLCRAVEREIETVRDYKSKEKENNQ